MKPENGKNGLQFPVVNIRLYWTFLVLIAVSTTAIYWQTRHFDFVNFDDPRYVTDNLQVQNGLTLKNIVWAFSDATHITNYWAPLTWISILLDFQFSGMNAGGYHITNYILHLINSLLLFVVFHRITRQEWPSGLVALLFAIHPLHVESVAWVTERKDVLSALFWILSMWAYFNYTTHRTFYRYSLTLILFMLGMMAKPMLVTLPFAFLLMDYWPLRRFDPWDPNHHRWYFPPGLMLEKLPFFLLVAVSSIAAYWTQHEGGAVATLTQYPLTVRIENSLWAYWAYLGQMVWPFNLAALYPHPGDLPWWQGTSAAILLGGVTVWSVGVSRKYPWLITGWLWYMGTLIPVIGLMVIGPHAMADRYTYIPSIGIFWIVAWALKEFSQKLDGSFAPPKFLVQLVAGLLCLYAINAWIQVRYWRNTETLFNQAIAVTWNNPVAHNDLGMWLAMQGRTNEALPHLSEAVKLFPGFAEAHNNYGNVLRKMGDYNRARQHLETAIRIDPQFAEAYNNLGILDFHEHKLQSALEQFTKAATLKPADKGYRYNYNFALSALRKSHATGSRTQIK